MHGRKRAATHSDLERCRWYAARALQEEEDHNADSESTRAGEQGHGDRCVAAALHPLLLDLPTQQRLKERREEQRQHGRTRAEKEQRGHIDL